MSKAAEEERGCWCLSSHLPRGRIGSIEDDKAISREVPGKHSQFVGIALDAPKVLELGMAHARYHTDGGLRQFTERGNLARVVASQFQDGDLMLWLQTTEREWHAQQIVIIAPASECREKWRRNSSNSFFSRGFCDTASDSEDARTPLTEDAACIVVQCRACIVDQEQGDTLLFQAISKVRMECF